MPRNTLIALIALFVPFVSTGAEAGDTDWWGRKLPNIPSQFIFGYGSLINAQSRNSTASVPIQAIPVRVSAAFGYIRTWSDRSPSGFTALGSRKPGPGEKPTTINGVLYPVEGDDMTKFDAREDGYARIEVPHTSIEPVSWQSIPQQGHVWVYVPVRSGAEPGVGLPQPDAAFPLLESYIDVVIEGGLEYGPEFARELIETTTDWSQFWLNDREQSGGCAAQTCSASLRTPAAFARREVQNRVEARTPSRRQEAHRCPYRTGGSAARRYVCVVPIARQRAANRLQKTNGQATG